LLAIAPTKSSSFILGQASLGIEPFTSNIYVKDLAKIKTTFKNPYLEKVLEGYGKNDRETWLNILSRDGSVQHLDFLTTHEKDVFKTFREISQLSIIQQAGQRQKFICQGQSLNLTIDPRTPTKDINALYLEAEKLGVKSLYYQNSVNAAQEFKRNLLDCASCEG
jgi:ribonucleoside-diphosphate reductase alpha chain